MNAKELADKLTKTPDAKVVVKTKGQLEVLCEVISVEQDEDKILIHVEIPLPY